MTQSQSVHTRGQFLSCSSKTNKIGESGLKMLNRSCPNIKLYLRFLRLLEIAKDGHADKTSACAASATSDSLRNQRESLKTEDIKQDLSFSHTVWHYLRFLSDDNELRCDFKISYFVVFSKFISATHIDLHVTFTVKK